MRKWFILLSLVGLILLTSCNQESTSTGKGSSAVIVVANQKEYNGTENTMNQKKMGELIGTVAKKTSADTMPQNNQSNYFKAGTKIYAVKGTENYIIVADQDNKKHLLKKAG